MNSLKKILSLFITVLVFSINNQTQTPLVINKLLRNNKFDSYMLLSEGVQRYSFLYKTILHRNGPNRDLKGEQYLLVDFDNFEIRHKVPNLPEIKISYFENALSKEELFKNPSADSKSVPYFDSSLAGWQFDEGFYFVPLLSTIAGKRAAQYRVDINFN